MLGRGEQSQHHPALEGPEPFPRKENGSRLQELLRNDSDIRRSKSCLKPTGLRTGLDVEEGDRVTNAFKLKM